MAEPKEEKKPTPMDLYRKKLRDNKDKVQDTILEGLKSTNSRVRSLAAKAAFRLDDHGFVKKNVLSLVNAEKSKKVLRTLTDKITRKEVAKKALSLIAAAKTAAKKKEAPAAEATPAAAPAPTTEG